MLWLASLIGLAGAGAASLVVPQTQPDDEDPNHDDNYHQPDQDLEGAGNLLDFDFKQEQTTDEASPFYLHEDFLTQEFASADSAEAAQHQTDEGAFYGADFGDEVSLPKFDELQMEPVALGDWVLQGPPAEMIEYEAEKESLMLVWDDLADGADEPEVRVEHDPDDAEVMHVVMNDYSIAEVHGDPNLSAQDVTVIPLSSALIVGLEPA